MQPNNLHGLYIITNDDAFDLLLQKLRIILQFPCVRLVQYRRKHASSQTKFKEAIRIQQLCLQHGVDFIINDDMHLAHTLQTYGNCGVHLGQTDGSLTHARELLGSSAIIGSTCHQSLDLAMQAESAQASYAAFGAYHASMSKPRVQVLTHAFIHNLQTKLNIPICVIGGIQHNDFETLANLKVNLIAVINDILNKDITNIESHMNQWQQKYNR